MRGRRQLAVGAILLACWAAGCAPAWNREAAPPPPPPPDHPLITYLALHASDETVAGERRVDLIADVENPTPAEFTGVRLAITLVSGRALELDLGALPPQGAGTGRVQLWVPDGVTPEVAMGGAVERLEGPPGGSLLAGVEVARVQLEFQGGGMTRSLDATPRAREALRSGLEQDRGALVRRRARSASAGAHPVAGGEAEQPGEQEGDQ